MEEEGRKLSALGRGEVPYIILLSLTQPGLQVSPLQHGTVHMLQMVILKIMKESLEGPESHQVKKEFVMFVELFVY